MDFFESPSTYEEPREDAPLVVAPTTAAQARPSLDLPELSRIAREMGPRDLPAIMEEARSIGASLGQILPDDPKQQGTAAYYRWEVRGADGRPQVIEGPTIDLMDALAGSWGRLAYQIEIIEERGQRVTLRARVVDLVTMVIHERPYIAHLRPAPARFARSETESERWRVMQLQSAESKAIRGVLERVIPQSVQATALEAARDAASAMQLGTTDALDGEGRPIIDRKTGRPVQRRRTLAEAIDGAVHGLARLQPPLALDLVERWLGRPRAEWVAADLGALRSLYQRWRRGEVTADTLMAEITTGGEPPVTSALDTLGLGSSTQPASSRGSDAGGASSSGASAAGQATSQPPAESAPSERRASVGEDLDALIRGLERAGGPVTIDQAKERYKQEAGVLRLMPARWDPIVALGLQLGKIRVDGNLVALVRAAPVAAPDHIDRMANAEVIEECRQLAAELPDGQVAEAFAAAGIPSMDGAPIEAMRRLLRALLVYVPGSDGT